MGLIDELADQYVADWAPLNPVRATAEGIAGYDDRLDDLTPDGYAARADLTHRTLARLDGIGPATDAERAAKEAMQERPGLEVERYDAGEVTSEVNVVASAMHEIRGVFDLMPTEGEQVVANIAARLGRVPTAIEQYERTLLAAADAGHVSAGRQMLEVAKQFDIWTDPDGDDVYRGLARSLHAEGALRTELDRGAEAATTATRELARSRRGRAFDLQAFHRDALNLGSMGLDPFRHALARL